MSAAEKLLGRLQAVRSTGPSRWIAKCPAHEDRSPSLSVREVEDGTVLIRCFAGCGAADVVAAVGLELKDLFPERPAEHRCLPSRARLDARDMLACLAHEGQILAVAADLIARKQPLTAEDADRIATAAGRVHRAWRHFNGHR